jgi:hypothetical protein
MISSSYNLAANLLSLLGKLLLKGETHVTAQALAEVLQNVPETIDYPRVTMYEA